MMHATNFKTNPLHHRRGAKDFAKGALCSAFARALLLHAQV